MPIPRYSAVVKRTRTGGILTVFAIWPTSTEAQACADNANRWYGEDHPLTPLTVVDDVLFCPPPFPEEYV